MLVLCAFSRPAILFLIVCASVFGGDPHLESAAVVFLIYCVAFVLKVDPWCSGETVKFVNYVLIVTLIVVSCTNMDVWCILQWSPSNPAPFIAGHLSTKDTY